MANKGNAKIEFRYYKMPDNVPVLALIGEKWKQVYGRDIDYLHFHNYLEIGYCYDGVGTLVLGKEQHRYHGGYFTVIPPNCLHTTVSDPGTISSWEFLFVDVDTLLNQSCHRGAKHIASRINSIACLKTEKEHPKIGQTIRSIFEIMRQKEELYLDEAKAQAAVLLINIARENTEYRLTDQMPPKETVPIMQSLNYISTHYMDPLKIEMLAEKCHISESHFRKIFSAYMGMGPMEFINIVRIRSACDYLKRTNDLITDIATRCGFSTFSTFSRNFRKVMGISPNEWRKNPDNYEQQLLKFSHIHYEEGW